MMLKRLLIFFLAAGFAGCATTTATIPFTAIGVGKPFLGMDNTAAKIYAVHQAQQRALKKTIKNLKRLGHINKVNREAMERCVAMYADDQSIEPDETPDGALEIRLKIDQAALDAIMKCAK
jgi:predicted solute-binding protein